MRVRRSSLQKKVITVALSLSLVGTLTGCGETETTVERQEVVVEVENPSRGDLAITGSFIGNVSPKEAVYVMSLVNGEVTNCYASVGDYVNAGDLLGEIDDSAAQFQVDSANASLATVQANKNATTGGANTLKNMQTEANIDTIKDNLASLEENRQTVVDAQAELQKQMDKLDDAKKKAKEAYQTAKENAKAAKALAADPSDKEAKKVLKKAGIIISDTNPIEVVVATCEATKQGTKGAYDQVKETYDKSYPPLKTKYDELDSSKKELDKNHETLNENLKLAEDSYALTTGQVAKETAAVYDAQIASAKVGVESAKYQKGLYTLEAPISGVIEAVNITENGFVSSGSAAFVISNKDSMKATFKVSEDIQKTLLLGDKITVEKNGNYFEGQISQIGQMVDAQSGLFVIEADIYEGGEELLTGTSVKLEVSTHKEKDTIMIPYDAIFYDNAEAYVYVAKEGKAVKTPIVVSLFNDTHAAVSLGLTEDDKVITTYSAALADGVSIVVKEK